MPFLAGRAYEASTGVVLAVSYLYTLASTSDYYRNMTPQMPFLAGRAFEASNGIVQAVCHLYESSGINWRLLQEGHLRRQLASNGPAITKIPILHEDRLTIAPQS